MVEKNYLVEKILNNNAIIVKDHLNNTVILIGKGIGFNQKPNRHVQLNDDQIQTAYYNFDESLKNDIVDMIRDYDETIIKVSNAIIDLAEKHFGNLNPHIYVSLTDHLNFAMDRLKNNETISNPFTEQIALILYEEYEIALEAKNIIKQRLNLEIPDDEVGFIAFHINAARENMKVNNVVMEMRLYKTIVQMIEDHLDIEMNSRNKTDLYYIIQSVVQKQEPPLQFLFHYFETKTISCTSSRRSLANQVIEYIETQVKTTMKTAYKNIIRVYINEL